MAYVEYHPRFMQTLDRHVTPDIALVTSPLVFEHPVFSKSMELTHYWAIGLLSDQEYIDVMEHEFLICSSINSRHSFLAMLQLNIYVKAYMEDHERVHYIIGRIEGDYQN